MAHPGLHHTKHAVWVLPKVPGISFPKCHRGHDFGSIFEEGCHQQICAPGDKANQDRALLDLHATPTAGGQGRLMAMASFNGGGNERQQGGGGKERHNNQIKVTAAVGGNNTHWHSTVEVENGLVLILAGALFYTSVSFGIF